MTNRPYTDADLRAEAARQHATLAEDPEFMCVGEAMENELVKHTIVTRPVGDSTEIVGMRWAGLLPFAADGGEAYAEAQRKIHDLINGAADVSGWAVALGAEDLTPDQFHLVDGGEGGPIQAAFHIALDPHLELDARAYEEITDVIRGHLAVREDI